MTLTSQIITDAFRQSNLVALGASPTTLQIEEALRYLNRILKSVFGNEAGEQLQPFPIGSKDIQRPSGYPFWNTVPDSEWFVPKNTRVMLNLEEATTLFLHPVPDDGSRFAALDVAGNLSTYNVILEGNGRRIEGSQTLTLSTDNLDQQWFYRADLGDWLLYAPLLEDSVFPFPEEFDDFFITLLAIRLNPSYGSMIDPQSERMYSRAEKQLKARYAQHIQMRSELGLIRPAITAADRDQWYSVSGMFNPNDMFDRGWPF